MTLELDTAAKRLPAIAGQGNIRTKSTKAFEKAEFRSIVKSLPEGRRYRAVGHFSLKGEGE